MKKIILAALLTASLAACTPLQPNVRDGQQYMGKYPVLYSGTLVDIQFQKPDMTVHSIAGEAASTLQTGTGSIANLASMTTGVGSVGGGLIIGVLGAVLESFAGQKPPTPPQLIIEQDNGEVVSVGIEPHRLQEAVDFACIELGEKIKVAYYDPGYYYFNADPRLNRTAFFQPSCDEIREKYNISSKG